MVLSHSSTSIVSNQNSRREFQAGSRRHCYPIMPQLCTDSMNTLWRNLSCYPLVNIYCGLISLVFLYLSQIDSSSSVIRWVQALHPVWYIFYSSLSNFGVFASAFVLSQNFEVLKLRGRWLLWKCLKIERNKNRV